MHRAPAVSLSTVRSRWHLRFIVALFVSEVATLVAHSLAQPQSEVQAIVVAGAMLFFPLVALMGWYQSVPGHLRWNGQHWRWSGFGDQAVCALALRLDWQRGLLVLLRCKGQRSVWLWLDACEDTYQWNAFRRALVSSQVAPLDGVDDPANLQHGEVA